MSTKRKAPGKLVAPTVKASPKVSTKSAIDESRTSVADADMLTASQADAIELSSDPDSDEDLSDEDEDDDDKEEKEAAEPLVNGTSSKPKPSNRTQKGQLPSPNPEDSDDDEETSPSFGELLRNNDAIDISALLQQSAASGTAVSQRTRNAIVPPPHKSLYTVLTQALRTDDTDLLESCLHTTDLTTIRNTIENIDSSLASGLLTKLAARLYRRPGRAASLLTWVQWTLVAHGGALTSQPKMGQNTTGLQKVLSERARGLDILLALKGKLDLLEGQMDMRRSMQRTAGGIDQDEGSEDDDDVVYVEGEDVEKGHVNGLLSRRRRAAEDDDDEDDDDELAMNGVMADSDAEEDESEDDDDDADEADESLDEDEVDHDDVDESMGEEDDSDAEAAPPSKVQKVAKSFPKRK